MKTCSRCGESKNLSEFSLHRGRKDGRQTRCKPCCNALFKDWRTGQSVTQRQVRTRARNLRHVFGLELYQYDAMLVAQSGLCAICGTPPTDRRLAVDHDHKTGEVRALLCQLCNRALGHMKDDPELLRAAARYLERHTT